MDAAELARQAQRLRLVTEDQLREVQDEVGPADAATLAAALVRKGALTDWQSLKLLKGDTDGFFMGGYRINYKIASGSFGRVYRGENPHTGEPVAVKELRRRWREDPHKVDLFEREGKMGLQMRHPNIVQIVAVNCDRVAGQFVIVMEFVEGENLRDLLSRRGKLEAKEALRITEEAAAGLAYAYSKGLTHRDLKPSNILLSVNGTAKLVDFGLAEITKGAPDMDDDGKAVDRTVDYAGLERATNAPTGDVRSDIFFLGTVLYEMLSGKPALLATRDRRARMLKSRFENIVPLSRDDVDAPPAVFQLLDRMLALDPAMRFQTPSQMYDAVRQVHAEVSGQGLPASERETGPRSVFIVEKNPKFQDVFREKFKAMGYRPLMSIDASRALQRFQQQAFHAFVLNVATTGEEGLEAFQRVQSAAAKQGVTCAGVVLLSDEHEHLRDQIPQNEHTAVLKFPLKKGELERTMERLLPTKRSAE